VKKSAVLIDRLLLITLLAALGSGCSRDDIKMIDVPRKDIPTEILNKPIPPEAFKTMRPASRKQLEKMEDSVKKLNPES
jgi:hypothetical protein